MGHVLTIVPNLTLGRGRRFDTGDPWSAPGPDLGRGGVTIRGHFAAPPEARDAVVLIHGLGGSPESGYIRSIARGLLDGPARQPAAGRAAPAVLRMGLRGAGEANDDIYHAALTEDLSATLRAPELAGYERIAVVGFSLGGHIALRWAMHPTDPRVDAVVAVCPPLDLAACQRHLDAPGQAIYRSHVLRGLKEMYMRVHAQRPLAEDAEHLQRVKKVRSIEQWDAQVVVPRFGFGSVQNYYAVASAGPRLGELQVPTLLIEAPDDPMIPASSAAPHLSVAHPMLTVRRSHRAGHVGFVPWLDLGFAGPRGFSGQVGAWIDARRR